MKIDCKKKLSSIAGESIGETLVALLISSLALLMLAGAITAASRVILQSNKKMEAYYKVDRALADLAIPGDFTTEDKANIIAGSSNVVIKDNEVTCNPTYTVESYTNKVFGSKAVIAYGKGQRNGE